MDTDFKPIRVWCLLRDQYAHVKPVETALGPAAEFTYDSDWDPAKLLSHTPDVVVCVNDYHYDVARCLATAREAGIPSLCLQDGILEWRCQYENPLFGDGGGAPQHQPVLADKIACIGAQSARQIAAWGNANKVEVTGMPRLDYLLEAPPPPPQRRGKRVLVMTAKNPGFTPEQREITVRSLRDIKAFLERRPDTEIFWRVSPKVVSELGVENQYSKAASQELTALVVQSDAVITTPSTAILEAMLLERPVAALDYHNAPTFVPTAWTVSAKDHLGPVLSELLKPTARKMAFQRDCLRDCLRCDGAAAPRVVALLRKMVRLAAIAKGNGTRLKLPSNVIEAGAYQWGTCQAPRLDQLYPDHEAFQESDIVALQLKVARLESERTRLQSQLNTRSIIRSLVSRMCQQWKRKRRSQVV